VTVSNLLLMWILRGALGEGADRCRGCRCLPNMMTSESKDQNMLQCRIRRSTSVVELLCYLYNQVYALLYIRIRPGLWNRNVHAHGDRHTVMRSLPGHTVPRSIVPLLLCQRRHAPWLYRFLHLRMNINNSTWTSQSHIHASSVHKAHASNHRK
jgi:hypothetical protein